VDVRHGVHQVQGRAVGLGLRRQRLLSRGFRHQIRILWRAFARFRTGSEAHETAHWRGDSHAARSFGTPAIRSGISEVKTAVRVGGERGGRKTKTRDPFPVSRDSIEQYYQTDTGLSREICFRAHGGLNETE